MKLGHLVFLYRLLDTEEIRRFDSSESNFLRCRTLFDSSRSNRRTRSNAKIRMPRFEPSTCLSVVPAQPVTLSPFLLSLSRATRDYKILLLAISFRHSNMSPQSENRLRAYNEILKYGRPIEFPCDRYFFISRPCIVMEGSTRLKCAECRKQNKPCVNLSWSSLDKTREKCRKKIEENKQLLSEVIG